MWWHSGKQEGWVWSGEGFQELGRSDKQVRMLRVLRICSVTLLGGIAVYLLLCLALHPLVMWPHTPPYQAGENEEVVANFFQSTSCPSGLATEAGIPPHSYVEEYILGPLDHFCTKHFRVFVMSEAMQMVERLLRSSQIAESDKCLPTLQFVVCPLVMQSYKIGLNIYGSVATQQGWRL